MEPMIAFYFSFCLLPFQKNINKTFVLQSPAYKEMQLIKLGLSYVHNAVMHPLTKGNQVLTTVEFEFESRGIQLQCTSHECFP